MSAAMRSYSSGVTVPGFSSTSFCSFSLCPLGSVFGRLPEAALADRGSALQFRLGKRLGGLGREGDAMLRQLGPDAPVAETGLAGMDPRFGKALGREVAVRLEPVEQGLDLLVATVAVVAGVAFTATAARLSVGDPGAGLGGGVTQQLPRSSSLSVALRQQLPRALQRQPGAGDHANRPDPVSP